MSLSAGNDQFSFDLYQALRGEQDGNLFFSPFSVSFALALAYAGARGATQAQMEKTLHFGLPEEQLHLAFAETVRKMQEVDESQMAFGGELFKLKIENSVWGQEGYSYEREYLELLRGYYGMGLKLLNFAEYAEEARRQVNRWVSQRTEGKIQDIIPPGGIDEMTRLVLANAIYFYAGWLNTFKAHLTEDKPFYTLNGGEVEVPMMGHLGMFERRKRSAELLELVGLADRMNHLPNQLSGGQRQRVAVARSLANKPLLVLADEPTGSLDSAAGQDLMHLLRDLNQSQGTTFIVVTHDQSVARQTNRVLVMEDGRIVREDVIGSPIEEDLKMWRYSGLGRRIVKDDQEAEQKLGLSEPQLEAMRTLLSKAEEDESRESGL